jgi:hypothetical protein
MFLPIWFILFSVACLANVLGLNISSAFNSAVTVYVMIPLLLIPQMILSGLLFSFDRLNDVISTKGKVPLVADMMASRWAYEALAVYQFKHNSYEEPYYDYEKVESQADFKGSFLVDELETKRKFIVENIGSSQDSIQQIIQKDITIIQETLQPDYFKKGLEDVDLTTPWTKEKFTPEFSKMLENYLAAYKKFYQDIYNKAVAARENLTFNKENAEGSSYKLNDYKNRYFNESLADLVKNVSVKDRIIEFNGHLIQQINPVFLDPVPTGIFDYRAHFFAPKKNLLGTMVSTFLFNSLVIWLMTLCLYITLYFELIRKALTFFGNLNLPIKK